jgi:hypothetical protein
MSSVDISASLKDSEDIEPRKASFSSDASSGSEEDRFLLDVLDEELVAEKFPPVDRGAGAWKFLLGCWLIEAVLWGISFSQFCLKQSLVSALYTAHF